MELSKDEFTALLNKYDAAYFHEEKPLISDQAYDKLVDEYQEKFGKYVPNSMAGLQINVVDLPSYAPSLAKIKKRTEFYKYVTKFKGPYVVMDKVDGMSIIIKYTDGIIKIYTHSTGGRTGSDVSHLLKYLNIPKNIEGNLEVRGELAILNDVLENEKDSPRNVVAGAVLASKNIKYDLIKKFTFFAFEVKKEIGMMEQLKTLQKLGFTVPKYEVCDVLDYDLLTKEMKIYSNVPRDGKVLCTNNYVVSVTNGLPKHKIAFKILSETRTVKVTDVIWEESRYGVMKPVVLYETVNLEKGNCSRVTGYHAAFIKQQRIGPNAVIVISRDIVPDIFEVLIPSNVGSLPTCDFRWDKTNTNIIVDVNDKVLIKRIYTFFKVLEAKFMGKKTIAKLYEGGLTTISDYLNTNADELINIDGFKNTGANRIVTSIKSIYSRVTLAKIMFGSCLFPNFDSKLQDVLDHIPRMFDILVHGKENDISEEELQSIPGIQKSSNIIINGIPAFCKFLQTLPTIKEAIIKNYKNNVVPVEIDESNTIHYGDIFTPPLPPADDFTHVLSGMVIVFSGDKKLTETVKNMGAIVGKSITKQTSLLVIDSLESMTSKQVKCMQKNIKVISLQEFKETYNIQ